MFEQAIKYIAIFSNPPCIFITMVAVPGVTVFTAYFLRFWVLLFRTEISANMVELNVSQPTQRDRKGWFMQHIHLVQPRLLARILFGTTFTLFALTLLLSWKYDFLTSSHCTVASPPNLVLIIYTVILSVAGIACGTKLRGERDALGIRSEFIHLLWTYGTILVTFLVIRRVDYQNDRAWTLLFQTVVEAVPLFYSLIVPLHWSFKQPPSSASGTARLLDVIRTPESYLSFLKYLEKEFATENLVFYSAVELYHRDCADGSFSIGLITQLYDEYIKPGAPMQVNISYAVHDEIARKIQDCRQTLETGASPDLGLMAQLFDRAQLEIFDLMKADSFSRYSALDQLSRRSLVTTTSDRRIELSRSSERGGLTPRPHSGGSGDESHVDQKTPGSITGV